MPRFFTLDNPDKPQILISSPDFLLVYKPPKIHSAPGKGSNLVEWCAARFPEIRDLQRPRGASGAPLQEGPLLEGGLLHRLDYETQGLLLFARNQRAFGKLLDEQNRGEIVKEYGAFVSKAKNPLPGFPDFSGTTGGGIESYFRPFGPGRKEVRPVVPDKPGVRGKTRGRVKTRPQGALYSTEILETSRSPVPGFRYFRLRIRRGFRHQIRSHLAWAGFPLLNDPVYGGEKTGRGILALRAGGIEFTDPATGERISCALPPLDFFSL